MELKVLASEIDHACRVAGLKTGNLSSGVAAYPPAEWSTQAVVEANVLGATPRGRALAAAIAAFPSHLLHSIFCRSQCDKKWFFENPHFLIAPLISKRAFSRCSPKVTRCLHTSEK